MSKQHHFVVFCDDSDMHWETAEGLLSGDDEPIWDTEAEEWIAIRGEDSIIDAKMLDELVSRLRMPPR